MELVLTSHLFLSPLKRLGLYRLDASSLFIHSIATVFDIINYPLWTKSVEFKCISLKKKQKSTIVITALTIPDKFLRLYTNALGLSIIDNTTFENL